MKEGRVIAHDTMRAPQPAMHPATRAGLIEIARRLDPVVLRWAADHQNMSRRRAVGQQPRSRRVELPIQLDVPVAVAKY